LLKVQVNAIVVATEQHLNKLRQDCVFIKEVVLLLKVFPRRNDSPLRINDVVFTTDPHEKTHERFIVKKRFYS